MIRACSPEWDTKGFTWWPKMFQKLVGNSSTLVNSLENLRRVCRTVDGCASLASKDILPSVILLIQSLPYPSGCHLLTLRLRIFFSGPEQAHLKRAGLGPVPVIRFAIPGPACFVSFLSGSGPVLPNLGLAPARPHPYL
ncbi:hypothetical protein DVH24_016324 [Malus domestica]|uniref:Uncharacterized protein n=1 Tax=Malus domestica TaxID=3750 RepID=A0A498HU57_MALDO|nr:hypothetical protein DVH24_016324 [Malus domestica]